MLWLAVANSLAMDFLVRMKIALTMSMSLLATLPFPRKVILGHASARAAALAARLSCAGAEMAEFREQLAGLPAMAGQDLSPSDDPGERARLMAELDVVVARDLFGLDRNQMAYLLEPRDVLGPDCTAETFAALRRAEERTFGEYRTRRLVLDAWDALQSGRIVAPELVLAVPVVSPSPLRRGTPFPVYVPTTTPCCEAEDWLAGLACDVLLRFGPAPESDLRMILTTPLPSDVEYANVLSTWTTAERVARLPAIAEWFRKLFELPVAGDLRIPGDADLSAILGDPRTGSLAISLVEAHQARQRALVQVLQDTEDSQMANATQGREKQAKGN